LKLQAAIVRPQLLDVCTQAREFTSTGRTDILQRLCGRFTAQRLLLLSRAYFHHVRYTYAARTMCSETSA
jgi:hypothetical protein